MCSVLSVGWDRAFPSVRRQNLKCSKKIRQWVEQMASLVPSKTDILFGSREACTVSSSTVVKIWQRDIGQPAPPDSQAWKWCMESLGLIRIWLRTPKMCEHYQQKKKKEGNRRANASRKISATVPWGMVLALQAGVTESVASMRHAVCMRFKSNRNPIYQKQFTLKSFSSCKPQLRWDI